MGAAGETMKPKHIRIFGKMDRVILRIVPIGHTCGQSKNKRMIGKKGMKKGGGKIEMENGGGKGWDRRKKGWDYSILTAEKTNNFHHATGFSVEIVEVSCAG